LARADALEPNAQTSHLTDAIGLLQNRFSARGLTVLSTDLPDVDLAIAPEALDIVLSNLLENSCQHQATQVRLSAECLGAMLHLFVQDNGTGISKANADKIFTPFFTTRRNSGGTGLGLEISQSLLKAYGGKISLAESEQGALFKVILPLHE
jgi:signal transduction histidine kinase